MATHENPPDIADGSDESQPLKDYTRALEKRLSEVEGRLLHMEIQSREPASKSLITGDNAEGELKNAAKGPSDDDAGPEPAQLPVVREVRKLNMINFANRFPDQRVSKEVDRDGSRGGPTLRRLR